MGIIDVPAAALDELRETYRELDEEVARVDASCKRCGGCCHFGSSGVMLYMGPLEGAIFFDGVSLDDVDGPETCPHLVGKNCMDRQVRTIGCRTYFCASADTETLRRLHEKYLNKAKGICERFGIDWEYLSICEWLNRLGVERDGEDSS